MPSKVVVVGGYTQIRNGKKVEVSGYSYRRWSNAPADQDDNDDDDTNGAESCIDDVIQSLKNFRDILSFEIGNRKQWVDNILLCLRAGKMIDQSLVPKSLADVLPGDLILVLPAKVSFHSLDKTLSSNLSSNAVRVADALLTGRPHLAPASHALIALGLDPKTGERMYLNHDLKGSRLISEKELIDSYEHRKFHVARCLSTVDSKAIEKAAFSRHKDTEKYGSNFGIGMGRLICSEAAGLVLAEGTDLLLPLKAAQTVTFKDPILGFSRTINRRNVTLTVGDIYDKMNAYGKNFFIQSITKDR